MPRRAGRGPGCGRGATPTATTIGRARHQQPAADQQRCSQQHSSPTHVTTRSVIRSDQNPQHANVTPTKSSQPPIPPDSRNQTGCAPISCPRPTPKAGKPGENPRRRPRARHPRSDPRLEAAPLDDVAVRRPHQGRDREPRLLAQLPADRQAFPLGRQRSTRAAARAAPSRHRHPASPETPPREPTRHRTVGLRRGRSDGGHRVRADPQLADEDDQRTLRAADSAARRAMVRPVDGGAR